MSIRNPCLAAALEELSLLATLKAARKERYIGWELRDIDRVEAAGKERIEQKKFPFELDGLLPWGKRLSDLPDSA